MKFLCDRCKTRYSIGDERVRGKILKIRCKNCANVITVREGMTADDDPARGRPTTAAPLMSVGVAAPANNGALASAFAEQLAKPPPALEEEWYVSIEGAQSGPYGLAEAQRWVGSKPFDAELHCWSEGFDDWLPVDKVSHFRGLRRKPAAPSAPPLSAPPPMPRNRASAMPAAAAPVAVPEDEPKPLFAATMASLEKAAPAPAAIPSVRSPSAQVPAIPTNGAKANGTGPATRLQSAAPLPSIKTNGTGSSASQAALAAAFDISAVERERDHEPGIDAFKDLRAKAPSAPAPDDGGDDGDDNLDIGEVSRVVNLADLARSHANKSKPNVAAVAAPRVAPARPSLGRMTNATPKLDPSHLGIDATASIDALPAMPEGLAAAPVVAQAHRRGLIMLIGVAALLLAGVTAALVFMLNKDTETDESGLGPQTHGIDTSRPEEVVRAHMVTPADGSASASHQTIHHPQPTQPKLGTTVPTGPESPDTGVHLKPEEIEDMATKNSSATNRCYMRAQRGEMGLEVGDLKKISVTLSVDKAGAVTDVQLSDHTGDSLGNCLANQIKRWKFRESSGGQFRFALAFANN
ncbi:MAG TPA: GYF domain-containing protein [Kofleriaceae bacterium]|nr:GYF domain-containing protein [Kofleriaceae bacterium]